MILVPSEIAKPPLRLPPFDVLPVSMTASFAVTVHGATGAGWYK